MSSKLIFLLESRTAVKSFLSCLAHCPHHRVVTRPAGKPQTRIQQPQQVFPVAVAVSAAASFSRRRRRLRRSKVYPVCVAVPEALAAAKYSRRRRRRRGRSKIFSLTLPGIL